MRCLRFIEGRAGWAAGLVVAAVLACAQTSYAQRGDQREAPEVRKLELRGVSAVSPTDLERSIATTESQCKSLLWLPLCMVSRSPTFWDRKYLNEDEFRRDVLRVLVFYWRRGFREAQVDTLITRTEPGRVEVVFDIREGPPTVIASLRIDYDSTLLDERRVQKLSILRAGDPLNLVVLDTMRLGYQLAMWDKGYADAQVDTIIAVDAEQRRADVQLRVIPNWRTTVGTITVRGNEQVAISTIQNSLLLRPGAAFRYVDLAESQRNLYESNLFRLAQFTVPPRPDSVKNINIELRETQMREAQVSAGFNNIDFVQADARFTNYNTFGGARRLDVTGVVGNLGAKQLGGQLFFREPQQDLLNNRAFVQPTWQIDAVVKQPAWLRKPENALALGGFAHRRAAPAVFIDRGYGGQLAFTRSLAPRASASSTYRFEVTQVEASDVYFCVNYGVCDGGTIASLQLHQRLSPIQLSATIDRSDIPFSPTKGYVARVEMEHASGLTLSDYRFNRAFAEVAAYTHFRYRSRDPRTQVLAGNLRFGWVQALSGGRAGDLLHPRERFYAGGSHSVRGYGESQLGPRILTAPLADLDSIGCNMAAVEDCPSSTLELLEAGRLTPRPTGGTSLIEGSVEYRMPFRRKMEWAVFLDAARIGGSALTDTLGVVTRVEGTWAVTPGVGYRYKSPVGPVRIDIGYNPSGSEPLEVVTSVPEANGQERLVRLRNTYEYAIDKDLTGYRRFMSRLTIHLSIGQAY